MPGYIPYYGYSESNPFSSVEEIVNWTRNSVLGAYTENPQDSSAIAERYIKEFNEYLLDPVLGVYWVFF